MGSDSIRDLIKPIVERVEGHEIIDDDGVWSDWLEWEPVSFQIVDFERGHCVARYRAPRAGNYTSACRDIEFVFKDGKISDLKYKNRATFTILPPHDENMKPDNFCHKVTLPFYYKDGHTGKIKTLIFDGDFRNGNLIEREGESTRVYDVEAIPSASK